MSPRADGFMSRDDPALADRLDQRVDALAGYELKNFAAGANLKMSAAIGRLEAWRPERTPAWGLTASVAVAAAQALSDYPLFAAQFDGRDRLQVPERPALGIGLDTGDHARVEVIPDSTGMQPEALAVRVEAAVESVKPVSRAFAYRASEPVSAWRNRKRWLRMVRQEVSQRFDYLVPGLQTRRFEREVAIRGHFQIHDLGARAVQEFKGFLRRPAVACLWILACEHRLVPGVGANFEQELRLPMVLVYAQELIPLDLACGFLGRIVAGLEQPESLLAGGPA
jgi:hypothetical protein